MNKKLVIIVGVVAMLIIIFSYFFYMNKLSSKKQENILQNNGQLMIINDKSNGTNTTVDTNELNSTGQLANHVGQVSDPVINQDAPEDDGTLLLPWQK